MPITRQRVDEIRQANSKVIGGKSQLFRYYRNEQVCDLLEFIDANLPPAPPAPPADAPPAPVNP